MKFDLFRQILAVSSGFVPFSSGYTFLMAGTGGAFNREGAHLMACITSSRSKDQCTVVPVVSRHEFSDDSCCLFVGDHPFIRHDSVVSYEFSRILSISQVEKELSEGLLKSRPSLADDVLKRMQIGFVLSDEVPPYIYTASDGPKLEMYLRYKGYIQ